MKKFLCILLSAALLAGGLSGCGGGNSDNAANGNGSATGNGSSTQTPNTAQALIAEDSDTMNLNLLLSLIGTPDSGIIELLGDGNTQTYRTDSSIRERVYGDNSIYGTALTFTVLYDESSDVSSIEADFAPSVTRDQLAATLTELIGQSPSEEGIWQAETAVISLEQKDDHICMILAS